MAQVINGKIKLDNGRLVTPKDYEWFDARQYIGGTLGPPGTIHPQSEQQGAGQAVSQEVIAQTNPANVAYVNQQRQQAGLPASPTQAQPAPAPQQQPTQLPQPSSGATGAGAGATGPIATPQPAIDLPTLYQNYLAGSGIAGIESDLSAKGKGFAEQVAKIKDNPYLSEANMTGRIKKLSDKFEADQANARNDIAMKKADIETRMNLELKQFDIESDQAKLALDQFNSLLSTGALDSASGEDIANLTRSTGISSTMIQSAIKSRVDAANAKNQKDIKTELKTFDDGTSQWAVLINTQTGEVISRTELGKSAPKTYAPDKVTVADKTADQEGTVGAIIQRYIKTKSDQDAISPEALYRKLLASYPQAADYIESYWGADTIRAATKK